MFSVHANENMNVALFNNNNKEKLEIIISKYLKHSLDNIEIVNIGGSDRNAEIELIINNKPVGVNRNAEKDLEDINSKL